jgi:hypothetical protein
MKFDTIDLVLVISSLATIPPVAFLILGCACPELISAPSTPMVFMGYALGIVAVGYCIAAILFAFRLLTKGI